MKSMIKIIRKVDIEKLHQQKLVAETDYWLASLYDAMQQQDILEMIKCKAQLKRIQEEKQHV